MHRLGLPLEYTFHDVVATEDWALDMVREVMEIAWLSCHLTIRHDV